jgi:N-acetylglucosaminyldiphosphoundecaprenol N-acetyl-beta-D-mannosaminyltransferase
MTNPDPKPDPPVQASEASPQASAAGSRPEPVWVWGVPFAPLTFAETLAEIKRLVEARQPGYFITANLHYAMLTARDSRLPAVNARAQFISADGMPLVWASRWRTRPLPERVTGADLVPAMCEQAAKLGHRVFFLGGAPGIAETAANKLKERFPALQVAGIEVPPFREPTPEEHAAMIGRIRDARADILFLAFGQPKGEIWLAENCETMGVPVCVQIGASLDFLAGKVQRAPQWIQRTGMEWLYRLSREPGRLISRYSSNALFAFRMLFRDLITSKANRR